MTAPVAVGDLIEVDHECPPPDCWVIPRACTHEAEQRACPEPPTHTRSLRVTTVTEGLYRWRVTLRACTGITITRSMRDDGSLIT